MLCTYYGPFPGLVLGLWCLTPLSAIFQLDRDGQLALLV